MISKSSTRGKTNINFGIISTAAIAHKVVAAMHKASNANAYAVASRSVEKAASWAAEHKVGVS